VEARIRSIIAGVHITLLQQSLLLPEPTLLVIGTYQHRLLQSGTVNCTTLELLCIASQNALLHLELQAAIVLEHIAMLT
jgi:hypothetical protein